jgi:hypothetical protein
VPAGATAAGRSVEEVARTAKAPASAVGAPAGAAAAATGAVGAPPEPLRKRKLGFSSLRQATFPSGAPDFEGLELNFVFVHSQGGADHPRPCAC